jgi:hypothetical protein
MHPFDEATALAGAAGAAVRVGHTSDAYWTFISPFGGASAATALRAVLEHPERAGDPLAVTVNFCAPIARGEFAVHVRRARANRSSQHWQVEFRQGESDQAVLTASVVTAVRRASWSHQPAQPPALPPFEALPAFPSRESLSWVAQYGFRFAEGAPATSEPPPEPPLGARSLLWLHDDLPRPLDFISLLAMSDAFFGRIFRVIGRIPPFGTVSMTTHFHASADELAAHGTAPLAAVADARVFHRSFCDQAAELFGRGGRLLATSQQIAYFRF